MMKRERVDNAGVIWDQVPGSDVEESETESETESDSLDNEPTHFQALDLKNEQNASNRNKRKAIYNRDYADECFTEDGTDYHSDGEP